MNGSLLTKRILIRRWQDIPAGDFDVTPTFDGGVEAWARHLPIVGARYYGAAQVDNAVTDEFTVRFREDVTSEHVIEMGAKRFRVKRVRPLEGGQEWTVIETEQLGPRT